MSKGEPGGWLQPGEILAEKQNPSAVASTGTPGIFPSCPCHSSEPLPFFGVPGFHQEPSGGLGRGHVLFCDFANMESLLTCPQLALGSRHVAATESISKTAHGCWGAACAVDGPRPTV